LSTVKIGDHEFRVDGGRMVIRRHRGLRPLTVLDVVVAEIVEVELGQTRKAGMKHRRRWSGRTVVEPFAGRTGVRCVLADGESFYVDVSGTPDEVGEAIGPVLDAVVDRGGSVLT